MPQGQLFNPQADAMLYAAACHAYMHPDDPFEHEGMPRMTAQQRDAFVDDTIARFITGAVDAPVGQRISAFSSVNGLHRIAAFTTRDDIAQPDRLTFQVFADVPYSDEFWRPAFMPITVAMGEREWEIHNVNNPVTWEKIPEGGQVRTQRVTSDKLTYTLDDYATEIGFTRQMMTGRRLYLFIAALEQARASYLQTLSDAHYTVLQTAARTAPSGAASSQLLYQGQASWSQLDRDIATINFGLSRIAQDLKDIVQNIMSMPYILYCPEQLEERMIAAVRARTQQLVEGRSAGAAVDVKRRVMVAPTLSDKFGDGTDAQMANRANLIYPGRKLQSADDGTMLDTYNVRDPKSRNDCRILWSTWGIASGDSRQAVELAFA